MLLGLIHLALPNAKIIHVRRDPIQTCLACFAAMFESGHLYSYDLGETGRYYRSYEALMRHWHSVLPERALLDVRFEEILSNPEREIRRVADHCGVDLQSRPVLNLQPVRQWRPQPKQIDVLLSAIGTR